MPNFHFNPQILPQLTWFKDSPDVGDPRCICSFCAQAIQDDEEHDEMPLRIFRESDNTELRLHMSCAKYVIIELSPRPTVDEMITKIESSSIHRNHPAFLEGARAFFEGQRRGSNPHSTSGISGLAWFAGWDAAWAEKPTDSKSPDMH